MLGAVSTGMSNSLQAGKSPRFVTSHSGQLSLLPSAGRKISTGQSMVMLCGWAVKAGNGSFHLWINVWVAGKKSVILVNKPEQLEMSFS